MEAFLRLVAEGKVNTSLLTTQRIAISQGREAYDLILNGRERCCGVVLEYPDDQQQAEKRTPRIAAKAAGSDTLRVSVIGAGSFARGVLLPLIKRSPRIQLLGVAAATGISAKNTSDQFGFSYATTGHEEILDDETSDAVFIITRHDSHAQLAAEALRRGKHVFVEKPLATTEDGLREVVTAARESSGLLMVGYNRRFAPIAREIKKNVDGRVGRLTIVYRVNAGQLPRGHWANDSDEGGGRIIGEMCHFIDFIQYLTDASPARVSAEAVSDRESDLVDDSAVVSIWMSDGSIASIVYTASGDSSVPKEHVEIFCDGKVAVIDDFKTCSFVAGGKKTSLGGSTQDKGHAAEVAAFFNAVRGSTGAPIELESLAATTLTTFAILESARTASTKQIEIRPLFS